MDLFVIDKLVVTFIKNIFTDTYTQFTTLVGLFIVSHAAFPGKVKK